MSVVTWVLLAVAFAVAVTDWWAVAGGRAGVGYLAKPGTMVALVAVAMTLHPVDGPARALVVAGLVLCLAGDVFLMLPGDAFMLGLGAFLLGHLGYIVAFALITGSWPGLAVAAVVVVAFALTAVRPLLRGVRRHGSGLVVPVIAYMVVICAMMLAAGATGLVPAIVGAALFLCSDALLAYNRFVRPLRAADLTVMITYHLAQAGIVLAFVR